MPSRFLRDAEPQLIRAYLTAKVAYEHDNPLRTLRITCTRRSPEEQQALYAQGRTKPGSIVTQLDGVTQLSNHNKTPARAIDFQVFVDGKGTWDEQEYLTVGPYMEAQGLVWGGRWKTLKDYPHVELPSS